jgi:hypothetical protein
MVQIWKKVSGTILTRTKLIGRSWIHFKVKVRSRFGIRIEVKNRIWIRIKVMRIRKPTSSIKQEMQPGGTTQFRAQKLLLAKDTQVIRGNLQASRSRSESAALA